MSYMRVIPRDLFNEANLLKCLGRIYICLERLPRCNVTLESNGQEFRIDQSQCSGAIYCSNVPLLNARDPWPLYASLPDDDECEVFTNDGEFTAEFLELIS